MAGPSPIDLALEGSVIGRLLGWIMGGLVFVAVLAAAIALALHKQIEDRLATPAVVTVALAPLVEVPDSQVDRFIEAVEQSEGVAFARRVSNEAVSELVQPWMAEDGQSLDVPLPRLIDITYEISQRPDTDGLSKLVDEWLPRATFDSATKQRFEEVDDLARARAGAIAVAAVAIVAAIVAVFVLTKRNFHHHRNAIDTLRLMGAKDKDLVRQFENLALSRVLIGSFIGFAIALACVVPGMAWLANQNLRELAALGTLDFATMALIPIATSILVMLSARSAAAQAVARLS